MTETFSSAQMRERTLSALRQTQTDNSDWIKVISVGGNQRLLALIASASPASIGELSALAGRAQPNVSRSLAALSRAGLVELSVEGRVSRPALTSLGREKLAALDLAPPAAAEADPKAVQSSTRIFLVTIGRQNDDDDRIVGDLEISANFRRIGACRAWARGRDLEDLSFRLLRDWWRIFHRRDTPYKVCDLFTEENGARHGASLSLKSWGRNAELQLFSARQDDPRDYASCTSPVLVVETELLEGVIEPVARSLTGRGRRDQPLHSMLHRLLATLESRADAEVSRTAGALGLCPYNLTDRNSAQIDSLTALLPQEDARLDFASAVLTEDLEQSEQWIATEERRAGDRNRLPGLQDIAAHCHDRVSHVGLKPWQRGVGLAREVRRLLSMGCEVSLGSPQGIARKLGGGGEFITSPPPPAALKGFQTCLKADPTFFIGEDGSEASTSFLFARAIGDYVAFRESRSCVADLYTDRQAVGRAFAAEFIAPAEAVVRMIDEEGLSEYRVASHFGATTTTVRNQYRNNAALYA